MNDVEKAIRLLLDQCEREILNKNDRDEHWRETAIKNAISDTRQKLIKLLRDKNVIS